MINFKIPIWNIKTKAIKKTAAVKAAAKTK